MAYPLVWQRREQNEIADFLVNCAMDRREGFHKDFDPIPGFSYRSSNFTCHSDGGTRSEICSAAAWYLEVTAVINGEATTFPLAMRALFLESSVSSFLAETLALEDAIVFFAQLLPKSIVGSKYVSGPAL